MRQIDHWLSRCWSITAIITLFLFPAIAPAAIIANSSSSTDNDNTAGSNGIRAAYHWIVSSSSTSWGGGGANNITDSNYSTAQGTELGVINNLNNQLGQWLRGVEVQFGSSSTPISVVSGTVNPNDSKRYSFAWTYADASSSQVSYNDGIRDVYFTISKSANSYTVNLSAVSAGDVSPPSFENSTPSTSSVTTTSLTLNTDLNEDGTAYYVVVADGATAPTVSEVKAGTGSGGAAVTDSGHGATSSTLKSFNITGLADGTAYDIYVVAEDDEGTPNVQASVVKVDVSTLDGTAPTLTSSTPVDNATGVLANANIVLTFSEAVDAETGNIVIKKVSDNSTVETIAVTSGQVTGSGTATITINPSVTLVDGTGYYVTIDATAFDDAASNSYSGISTATTLNFTIGASLSDPKNKSDVMASIESWANITQRSSEFNIRSVNDRLDFLRRNQGSKQLSHQGIKFNFTDESIDFLMNGNSIVPKDIDAALQDLAMSGDKDKTKQAKNTAKAILLAATEDFVPNLHPTGSEVYGDWSGWTAGEVTVGYVDATSAAAKQKIKANHISIGMDKPISEQERIGFSFSIAEDNVDIGTAGSFVNSNNYGVSTYGSFIYPSTTVQGLVGYGSLNFDTKRIDGAQTLTGTRKGDQIFTSVTMRSKAPSENGMFVIAPYGRFNASYTTLKKFAETGGSLALTHNQQNITSTSLAAGLDITSSQTFSNGMFKPYAKVEIASDMSSGSDAKMYYTSASSTVYSTTVNSANDTSWRFEIGSDIFFVSGATGSVYYAKGGAGSSEDSDSFGLRLGWTN